MSQTHPLSPSVQEKRWPQEVPDVVWAPIASGLLILIVGLIGYAFREPWLFPSLGPTAYMLVETPQQPTTKFYNVFIGHMCGMGAGIFGVWVIGAYTAPPVMATDILTAPRVWASIIATAVTVFLAMLLHASHPPAAATTLLFSLGAFKFNTHSVISLVIGVAIIAGFGEILRLARLRRRPSLDVITPSHG